MSSIIVMLLLTGGAGHAKEGLDFVEKFWDNSECSFAVALVVSVDHTKDNKTLTSFVVIQVKRSTASKSYCWVVIKISIDQSIDQQFRGSLLCWKNSKGSGSLRFFRVEKVSRAGSLLNLASLNHREC